MQGDRSIEIVAIVGALLIGGLLLICMIVFEDDVPAEYRSTSPGFGWSWDFDYEAAMREAGRPGAKPWPWLAKATGNRLLLPLNQTLIFRGLELTYRGMPEPGTFRLDIIILKLDSNFTYQKYYGIQKAKRGITIAENRFALEKITPQYLRLHSVSQ